MSDGSGALASIQGVATAASTAARIKNVWRAGPAAPLRDARWTPWPLPDTTHFVRTAFGSVRPSVSTPRLGDSNPLPRRSGPLGSSEDPHRLPHGRWSSLTSCLWAVDVAELARAGRIRG